MHVDAHSLVVRWGASGASEPDGHKDSGQERKPVGKKESQRQCARKKALLIKVLARAGRDRTGVGRGLYRRAHGWCQ